jgi:hypothetical protein
LIWVHALRVNAIESRSNENEVILHRYSRHLGIDLASQLIVPREPIVGADKQSNVSACQG